jgi:hypothetical protein
VRALRERLRPDMHRSERKTTSCVACWIVGSSPASLWVAPDGVTPLFERGGPRRRRGVIPRSRVDQEGSAVIQQGQVFKLQARCADGEPLWAYRYRVAGRGSARLQVGGFSSKAEA